MSGNFDELSPESRLWIYISEEVFPKEIVEVLNQKLKHFTENWKAHEIPLKAAHQIFFNQIIVLAVDEEAQQASGCSIDKSIHLIQSLEDEHNLKLFNRQLIPVVMNHSIEILKIDEFKLAFQKGKYNQDTIILDNTISSLFDLKNNWKKEVKDSWAKRYLNLLVQP